MRDNKKTTGILAIYKYLDDLTKTLEQIKDKESFSKHVVYSHTSYHELIDIAEEKWGPSQVRWFTLVGALTGVITGFGMCLLMDYDWPIVVGGKSAGIYSLPAYFIFGFELMVLFGAIATIIGMLVMGRLPNPHAKIYDNRLTDDHFAIYLPDTEVESEQAKLFKEFGAIEIIRAS